MATERFYLEFIHGIWAVLELCLIVWFSYYIGAQVNEIENFTWTRTLRNWWYRGIPAPIDAAVAIYVFAIGDFIVRTRIWFSLHYFNAHNGQSANYSLWPLIIGGIIAAIGVLCKIRIFTKYRLGNTPWMLTLAVAIVLVCMVYLEL